MKNEVDANKSLEKFFETAKAGEAIAEKPVEELLAELDAELNSAHPVVASIHSLLYRLGNAILAESRAIRETPPPADLPAWQATLYLMEIGNTASRLYQTSRHREERTDNHLIQVVGKARSVVLQIFLGKILTQDRTTGFDYYCWDHPLFPPLIDWLGHGENQSGNIQEIKLIDSFLYQLSLDAAATKTIPPPLEEKQPRIALAKVFSQALDREKYFELLPSSLDVVYRFNLIEIMPYLAEALWPRPPAIRLGNTHPRFNETVSDLVIIAPPDYRLARHWSIFCELWPEWVIANTR